MSMPPLAAVEHARREAERVMVDTCRITRDAQGALDDTLDETTGRLSRPVGEPSTVYEGKCWVGDDQRGERTAPDVRQVVAHRYRVRIPMSAPEIKVGDRVEVLTSEHDSLLVGESMKVLDVRANTAAITRQLVCELALGERP